MKLVEDVHTLRDRNAFSHGTCPACAQLDSFLDARISLAIRWQIPYHEYVVKGVVLRELYK